MRELVITKTLNTPVNFIVHSRREVNDGLAHGRYFFMEIAKEGMALFQSDESELPEPKPKTLALALAMAKEYFEEWTSAAMSRFKLARVAINEGLLKDAAFDLHHTTERLYHCVLLVMTFYTPHNHNIAFLRTQAERLDRRLLIWPMDSRKERAIFAKLKDAYVKARYSRHYRITMEELTWLDERVEELGRAVHAVCAERIAELEAAARQNTAA